MLNLGVRLTKNVAIAALLAVLLSLFSTVPARATDSAPTAISPSSLGSLYTNLTLNQELTADGTPNSTLEVSAGSLPDGLSFSAGWLLGTPTTVGAYSFTVTATNSVGSFSQIFTGVITNGKPGVITPSVMPELTAGVQSVVRFTTDGNPAGVITLVSGSVPSGMVYSSGSVLGTPTTPGPFSFTLRSTNAFGIKDVVYSGSVLEKSPTSISPDSIGSLYTNSATAITFSSNGIPSANFTVSSGSLPDGLALNSSTGALTGTATTAGAYAFTLRMTNARGSFEKSYSGSVTNGAPSTFSPSTLPSIAATDAVNVQISADGNPAPTFSIQSGSLPTGLNLSSTGLLSGSTTDTGAYSFTVRATNSVSDLDITYSGTVSAKAPVAIAPSSLGNLYMTQAVNATIASIAYPAVSLSISVGALPTGLSFDPATGVISGTPTTVGAYSFTIDATQTSSGTTISRTYSGVVRSGSITSITPASLSDIPGGIAYSQQLESDSYPAASFVIQSGSLPAGLSLSSGGLISGIPNTSGSFSFTVRGTAADGTTADQQFGVNVVEAAPTQITPANMPTLTASSALGSPIQLVANGLPTATFSVTSGSLPAGLSLSTGQISGTPTTAGAYSFTITATNPAGSFSKTYTGNVQSRSCPTTTCVLNNNRVRFGNGTENSINQAGLVNQPWYFSSVANTWKKLTYSSYPLNMAVSVGSAGAGYPPGYVTELSAQSGASMTNQDIDYREFVITSTSGSASIGYGKITVKGTFTNVRDQTNAVVSLEVTHVYELAQNDNFIKITTTVKNVNATGLTNVLAFVGTQDDWVGDSDRPTKTKGNLVNGSFTPITVSSDPASVLQITSGAEGVLFYSTTQNVNMSVSGCCSFANAYQTNPTASPMQITNDGSYAANFPFGTLAAGASSELTWFYAAGATADLSSVVQAIAAAAAPVAPRVTRGNGQATLSWDAPESTDPIVNYTIRYKKTTDTSWTNIPLRSPASTATMELIGGLQNGSTYTFQVAAISRSVSANVDVTGAWSATSLPALIGYPDAPTVISAVGANGQVTISITPGASEASPITAYEYSIDGGVSWLTIYPFDSSMTTYTISGLPNGGSYQVQVRAKNIYGTSTPSNTVTAYTNPVWIDRFLNGMVVGRAYNDGVLAGANISSYSVSGGALPAGLSLNSATGAITGTPTVVGSYAFTISAQNSAATLTQAFSGTVTNFGFTPTTTTFNLDVAAPFTATVFGSDSVGIALSPSGATLSWVSGALPSGVTSSFVSNGVYGVFPNLALSGQPTTTGTFTRTLRMTDGTGRTADATLTFVVVRALSGAPIIGSPTLSSGTLSVPFTEGAAGTSPVTSYQYSLDNGASWQTYSGGTTSPLVITGLTDGNNYQIKLRAVNASGSSSGSNAYNLLMTPAFSDEILAPFVKDAPYSDRLIASANVTYTLTGNLPNGISFDTTTGEFSGTPTTLENYSFTIRATNASGFIEKTFTSLVLATLNPSIPAAPNLPSAPKTLPRLDPILSEAGKEPGDISAIVESGSEGKEGAVLNVLSDSLEVVAPDWALEVKAIAPGGRPVAPTSIGGLTVESNHSIELGGSGFLVGSKVAFYVMSTPTLIGELEVNQDGKFNGNLPLPASLELGNHTLQIRGYSPTQTPRAVSLGFLLIEKRTEIKTTTLELYFKPNSAVLDSASKKALTKFIRQVPKNAISAKLLISGSALDIIKQIAGNVAANRASSVLSVARSIPVKLQTSETARVVPAALGNSGRVAKLRLTFTQVVVATK